MVNTSQRLDWGEYVAQMLREVAEQESEGDIKYKVVERGGKLLEKMLTNINPTKSDNCSETDCVVCASPGGGWLCHKTRIAYKIQRNNCDAVYIARWAKSGGHAMEFPIIVLKRIQRSFHIRKTPRGHVYSNINGVCAVYFVFFYLCSLLNILEMRKCACNERK